MPPKKLCRTSILQSYFAHPFSIRNWKSRDSRQSHEPSRASAVCCIVEKGPLKLFMQETNSSICKGVKHSHVLDRVVFSPDVVALMIGETKPLDSAKTLRSLSSWPRVVLASSCEVRQKLAAWANFQVWRSQGRGTLATQVSKSCHGCSESRPNPMVVLQMTSHSGRSMAVSLARAAESVEARSLMSTL